MTATRPVIAVLGASGLIGEAVARALDRSGYPVLSLARRFTPAQRAALPRPIEQPIVTLSRDALARLLSEHRVDILVNCIGVLQDSRRSGSARAIHADFVGRLVEALEAAGGERLLVHLSVPGRGDEDRTEFSATKREAERILSASGRPFVILRPGFVLGPPAFGGSALLRSLAMLPVGLPPDLAARPFAATALGDVARTVATIAKAWGAGERRFRAAWDVMEAEPGTVGDVLARLRRNLGGPAPLLMLPGWLMTAGARLGDLASSLGWAPPIRSTALAEMRRGVEGDPRDWMAATGLAPHSLPEVLRDLPATVQERWFGRLYLLKAAILAGLSLFWIASGAIALISFDAAAAILSGHGLPRGLALAVALVGSLFDIAIGATIAHRASAKRGLQAGIALSAAYMAAALVLLPDLWLDPLGPLVKTGPAILLMLVALAVLDER